VVYHDKDPSVSALWMSTHSFQLVPSSLSSSDSWAFL